MKTLIDLVRAIVGILFIFSGLVKANDPLGLSYKMQEFFEVWNFHWLDQYTLAFSIVMIVFEIIAGVAVLLGWRMKLFSWLLLLLILFFTFLTGYAYLSGKVRECGCFGNCIPLTAGESFTKDLVLLVLIVFLFVFQRNIRPVVSQVASGSILILSLVVSIAFQWYVLVHLPLVDCLPYKAGTNIPEKMRAPAGSIPDSTEITMVYEKNGKRMEFNASHFPADFDDTYKFISRYDKLVRKGNADIPIKDFQLMTGDGADSTQAMLGHKGYKLFLFMQNAVEYPQSWMQEFSVLMTMARGKGVPVFLITADYEGVAAWAQKAGISSYISILKCDGTAIKTAARANPVLYLIKGGTVIAKWSYADFGAALPEINSLPEQDRPAAPPERAPKEAPDEHASR